MFNEKFLVATHCRACGGVFCSMCSQMRERTTYDGPYERVCRTCYRYLRGPRHLPPPFSSLHYFFAIKHSTPLFLLLGLLGSLQGKVVLISGGNSGLGKAVAREMAFMEATVVFLSRDSPRGTAIVENIKVNKPYNRKRQVSNFFDRISSWKTDSTYIRI